MSLSKESIILIAAEAKDASSVLAGLSTNEKNKLLFDMADSLIENSKAILSANEADMVKGREKGLSDAMLDRLRLDDKRIKEMADALKEVASLNDPVGEIYNMKIRPNGIRVGQMTIPLGVICMIYESRPNVTSDAAGLCLKAGNAVILRGGSEAFNSNTAIAEALGKAMKMNNIPTAAVSLIPTTDREAMLELLKLEELIDLVIPRGGEGLIRFVSENSRIPVIKHYKGVCHLYIDSQADFEIGMKMLADGKLSRPGVCNALETMLVHKDVSKQFLIRAGNFLGKNNVVIRGCEQTREIIPFAETADESDYAAEYLSLKIAVKVVSSYEEAIAHIKKYNSNHTEVIVTDNYKTANRFIRDINSSVVLVNASSRFSDGGQLGLGSEIGISTTKLHAYGPMGIDSLTTKKFVVFGEGQTRHNIEID